jgi:hypothetical protein
MILGDFHRSRVSNPSCKIYLIFACLREAPPPEALRRAGASAKAGILNFGFHDFRVFLK